MFGDYDWLFSAFLTASAVGFMFLITQCLVQRAKVRSVPQIQEMAVDKFRDASKGQNWSWDLALAFNVLDERDDAEVLDGSKNEFRKNNTLRQVLKKLAMGGLETKCFYSRDRDKVFVKVRASRERLAREADRINFKVRLDEIEIQKRLADGSKKDDGSWKWFPKLYNQEIIHGLEDDGWCEANYERGVTAQDRTERVLVRNYDEKNMKLPEDEREILGYIEPIQDVMQQTMTPFYKDIFGEYSTDDDMQALYHQHWRTSSPFRGVDRLKLIISIIECRESEGGCQYEYEKALTRGATGQNCLEAFFPLHDEVRVCKNGLARTLTRRDYN